MLTAVLGLAAAGGAHDLRAQGAGVEIAASGAIGAPGGWVRVGENALRGDRLAFHHDLGVPDIRWLTLALDVAPGARSGWRFVLDDWMLTGDARLARAVDFNGATLAAGSPLATRTSGLSFLQLTAEWRRRLAQSPRGGTLSALAGLTFVSLEFQLRGTLAPGSGRRETKEDFVTQELPVPIAGLMATCPLGSRLALRAAADIGGVPWVNSLRREGGEVRLRQLHADLDVGVRTVLTRHLALDAGLALRAFVQHELSGEDDNVIHVRTLAVRAGFARTP
jgi:hypothetical protein